MINLANVPLANIWFPDNEARSRVVAAVARLAAAGAATNLVIPNEYPPIDRTIPCPVLAIFTAENGAVLGAVGQEAFAIAGQMGTALAADSIGEFRITAPRIVEVFQTLAATQVALIIYVAKGSGQET